MDALLVCVRTDRAAKREMRLAGLAGAPIAAVQHRAACANGSRGGIVAGRRPRGCLSVKTSRLIHDRFPSGRWVPRSDHTLQCNMKFPQPPVSSLNISASPPSEVPYCQPPETKPEISQQNPPLHSNIFEQLNGVCLARGHRSLDVHLALP